jgi:hypothetical protein
VKDSTVSAGAISFVAALLSCGGSVAAALIPGAQPALAYTGPLCAGAVLGGVSSSVVLVVDPPDSDYAQIARPRAPPLVSSNLQTLCVNVHGSACERLVAAAKNHIASQGKLASLMEALAVTSNRFQTAQANRDVRHQRLQFAVSKVYLGRIADAQRAERVAARVLADEIAAAGLDFRVTPDQLKAVAPRLEALEGIPPAVIARVKQLGLDTAQIQQLIRQSLDAAIAQGATFDLRESLLRPVSTSGFSRQFRSITVKDLRFMVTALTGQRVVSRRVGALLDRDLSKAASARGATKRGRAIKQFRTDVRRRVHGFYSSFLSFAATPLAR